MNSIIIPQVFFAIIVQAGQIKYTCEQAELYCNDGHFIPQENVCETYPDDIDPRPATCLSDEPWICDHLVHFRLGLHQSKYCDVKKSVGNIGAAMSKIRLWNVDKHNGKNLVPFFMDSSFSSQEKQQIRSAAKALSDAIDCVTIMEVSSNSRYESKIKVTKSGGCWSYIGRVQNRAGYQALSLGRGCVQKGVIQHEFLHALGFGHEQNRPDRDNYVIVQKQNIQSSALRQYEKLDWNSYNNLKTRYEIGSGTEFKQ